MPHRQVVFTIPKMVRPFFRYKRSLLSDLCLCAVRATRRYMEVRTNRVLMPGVVAVIQTFGNRLNFHPHLHMLVTEGGTSADGRFYPVPIFNDAAIARIFAHEVLSLLVARDLISTEIAAKILSWRHTGFGVHSKVRTTTRDQAQRVARYMAKPILALKRLAFDEAQGMVIYQYGKTDDDRVEMDYLEFIARVTAHIPDKGQVMARYLRHESACISLPLNQLRPIGHSLGIPETQHPSLDASSQLQPLTIRSEHPENPHLTLTHENQIPTIGLLRLRK